MSKRPKSHHERFGLPERIEKNEFDEEYNRSYTHTTREANYHVQYNDDDEGLISGNEIDLITPKWYKRLPFLVVIAIISLFILNSMWFFDYHYMMSCYKPANEAELRCRTTSIIVDYGIQTGYLMLNNANQQISLYTSSIIRTLVCTKRNLSEEITFLYREDYLNISNVDVASRLSSLQSSFPLNVENTKWHYDHRCRYLNVDEHGLTDKEVDFEKEWFGHYIFTKLMLIFIVISIIMILAAIWLMIDIMIKERNVSLK